MKTKKTPITLRPIESITKKPYKNATHGECVLRKNYVLIDYENVQPSYMAALDADHFHVLVFVGASQTKVTYEVASALQEMGDRAEYI